ncbi:MAG: YigZ family protein [Bacteroidales bacterium]|nr:YigZ family protein [Bacteroidales bacterium]
MAELVDIYQSVASEGHGLYKDKGSRFISFAYPVESLDEVKEKIDALRKEYHDARHRCYAYRIGCDGSLFRANDDGEPSSSAGKPILGQIDSAGLSDVLVVVVRYFGGIKLGVPGLIHAYRTAAADALLSAGSRTKTACRNYRISFDYISTNDVMKLVKDLSLSILRQEFGEECVIEAAVRLTAEGILKEKVANISSCRLEEL